MMNVKCYSNKWMNYKNKRKFCSQKVKNNQHLQHKKINLKNKNLPLNRRMNKSPMFHKDSKIWTMVNILLKITEIKQKRIDLFTLSLNISDFFCRLIIQN